MNYNPRTDSTLLSAIASDPQADALQRITREASVDPSVEEVDVQIGSEAHSYVLRLVTSNAHLALFWRLNFPQAAKTNGPD